MIRFLMLCVVSLLSIQPGRSLVIEDSCRFIEHNTVLGNRGVQLTQIIFWEWRDRGVAHVERTITGEPTGLVQYGGGFVVVDYIVERGVNHPSGKVPQICRNKDRSVTVIFWDNSDNVMRKVTGQWISYTKTIDREQENLKVWSSQNRRGLTSPSSK